ncbi:hypothetical protein [Streptomyces sp. WAC05858]|uniref:hypothetical protein n=1 Tax=Streptomyces TaxID=1883 RepID=UPI00163B95AC|nr:hypothetical protein [Streptomyces sp. WAC05858]
MNADPPPEPDAPMQLTLPEALLAAMRIPDAVPSARRRGRPVHSTPDIANYQETHTP